MSKPLLSIRDLHIEFRTHGTTFEAVRGASFDIPPRTTVALVGESGSGKSVISKAIMGLLPDNGEITRGEILLNDPGCAPRTVDIARLSRNGPQMRALRGGCMSMIFQEPMVSLSPLHTVGDQVSEALFLHHDVSRDQGMETTREMLQLVGFSDPAHALNLYPFELSGGLRQRAMIAMALICQPSLLIADEPTTALDVTIQAQILKLMGDLQQKLDMAVLMITHDLGVVANVAEQVVVLYYGQVMESGALDVIYRSPGHPYTQSLLRAVPHFDMLDGERLQPIREVEHEIGEQLSHRRHADRPEGYDEPLLTVRNLSKRFRVRSQAWSMGEQSHWVQAVNDVSFELRCGECLGLVGESGCGKSTLSKMLVQALKPSAGEIVYHDAGGDLHVGDLKDEELFKYRKKVQYIFQDPVGSLNPRMTVFDILREPLVIHKLGGPDYQVEMCRELMRLVGLDPRFLRRYPHSFSGGQRQRIGIARALALQPDLLICDEPVSALDVSIQAQVLNLLKDLQQELRLSYLFISHNLAVVDYVANRIAVMYRGEIVEITDRQTLFEQPLHPYTRTLLAAVPFADLDKPLDFDLVGDPRASLPALWEPPYRVEAGEASVMRELEPGHWVRVAADTALESAA
ncbi:MAG: ABC transporter ATP-binding protein [Pseudomonadota bacterium]|nr:ABC transporter ATP-binding protein [Pseudomonadota bacterium]